MTLLARLACAGLSGYLLSLAFEPVAFAYLMPFALAGLALTTRGVGARAGFAVALVFGGCFYFVHIWWMQASIGTVAWVALATVETLFIGLFGAIASGLHRLRLWPAWLAIAWTGVEVVRSEWPLSGMPWGRLGFGVIDTPMSPALAYVGINGSSLLVALLGFLLARAVVALPGERLGAAGALVGTLAAAVTPSLFPWSLAATGTTTVAVVQGNVPGRGNDILADFRGVTSNHRDATVELAEQVARGEEAQPDFVLWPENSTAVDPLLDQWTRTQIDDAVQAIGVPVVVGAIVDDGDTHVLNQGIVWDPTTGPGQRYTKRHPVPYGEYIPFRSFMERLGVDDQGQLARIPRDMRSGRGVEPLDVGGVLLADAICFDIAYDAGIAAQIENGAQLLIVQTSNASFVFTDQLDQQFAITRARAVESGKATLVSSTNGISGVIGPDGEVSAQSQRRTQEVMTRSVALTEGVTPGTRIGVALRWATPAVTVLMVLLVVLAARTGRLAPATYRRPVPTEPAPSPPPDPEAHP